ncbi:IS1595 family transposase [Desulfovibrio psychrotolerans]|uniref:DDE transposase n=1 Tax=Desulfovibrio psychrotolerans TaxID=415242 RepID=A0A7J0BVD6_9BACT|nr:IS1595 family transposase [Desulfovibrio psychrotolerans]GFM37152.1 DDE transposase [Desulfovibrio psychrotolerans]
MQNRHDIRTGGPPAATAHGISLSGDTARNEERAREYLLSHCWPSHQRFCPRCRAPRHYTLSAGRYRCAECRYTFQELSGRWINNGNLPPLTWLRIVDLFAREKNVHELASELDLSYNAAYKAVTTIRFAIMAHAMDAAQMFGPETGLGIYLKGKKLTGIPRESSRTAIPVFGILERNGWVFIDLVSGISAETVFHFNHSFHLAMHRNGYIVHTNRYRHYDTLVFCGDDSLPYQYIRRGEVPEHTAEGSFWAFAEQRLKRFKGVTPQRFPLYLKELEFRYNHPSGDIFDTLVRYLCDLVPEYDTPAS